MMLGKDQVNQNDSVAKLFFKPVSFWLKNATVESKTKCFHSAQNLGQGTKNFSAENS